MCISDYRLGRYIRHSVTAFNTTGGAVLTIPASLQRVRIEFHVGIAIATSASWVNVLHEGKATGILTLNQLIRAYDIRDQGDVVQRAWSVTQGSGNITGNVFEFFLDEQTLQSHWDEFKRRM